MPVRSSLTFAILPRCVPGQAKERREENNRSGHSSISEPHLISATPLLGSAQCRGPRNYRCQPPPFAFRVLTRVCKQTYGDVRRLKKYGLLNQTVNTDLSGGRGECSDVPSLGASFLVDIPSAFAVSSCTIIRRPVTNPLLSVTRYNTSVV